MESKNVIIIVHGTDTLTLATKLSEERGVEVLSYAGLTYSDIYKTRRDRSVIIHGPLYESRDDRIMGTVLLDYLSDADEVYRQTTPCSDCHDIDACAELIMDGIRQCRECAANRLMRMPPRVTYEGEIIVDNNRVTVKVLIPPVSITRGEVSGTVLFECIQVVTRRLTGPGFIHYKFKVPRSLDNDMLSEVQRSLTDENITVEWL